MSDCGSYDESSKTNYFISMKMSHFITLIALLLCRRSPHTHSSSCVGGLDVHSWVVWVNVTGDRERNREEDTAMGLTLIFLLYRCILYDSLICNGACAGVGASACPKVCGPFFFAYVPV